MSTDRKITLGIVALILACVGALMLMGDPCDAEGVDTATCERELNDR